jgi:hypothetical protein
MKVFTAMPTSGVVFTEALYSVGKPDFMTETAPVSAARNQIVEAFLKSDATHLLTVDYDEVVPKQAILPMLALNASVVVIDCPSKATGKSNIFRNDDGIIAATGFGCALFTRQVFETIPDPWFDLSPRRKLEKHGGKWTFPTIDDAPPNPWGGEDLNFCVKLKEHGFTIVDVPGLVCTHLEYEPFLTEKRATELLPIRRISVITGPPL